ncbi:MAG: four-carbon acid sugar kinase family protein [Alphaproteobacteria bacterium]|jgi:uncharacterized protein YgbK (DUF1537 family)|nr:four-carbon acid sugar kinase family protein [Alphaproteobacteria bacterium]MDP6588826.1 four-carbon acid sugar kinase family protein [Alphaproteobacteria bacterium]MDP6819341.1 four-carbon acid sugar kinase family protein [Alphaproteobacteria bacterium]
MAKTRRVKATKAKGKSKILLGAIADDIAGATDLCDVLVGQGMRTVLEIGVPRNDEPALDADAVVIALSTRTGPAKAAVRQSLAALRWLQARGAKQIFFKYRPTFDSTNRGNIGPVADALLDAMDEDFTVICPAFPTAGRTLFQGHLFVDNLLLSESFMRTHPATPMKQSNLIKVLGRQTRHKVDLVPHAVVTAGPDAIANRLKRLRKAGNRFAIVDAVTDRNLVDTGIACRDMKLVTGSSGAALALPKNFRRAGLLGPDSGADILPPPKGFAAVVAGSCSEATLVQIEHMKKHHPAFFIDGMKLGGKRDIAKEALEWAKPKLADGPVLIYSSADADKVKKVQRKHGVQKAGDLIEGCLAKTSRGLVKAGVGQMIVAGGLTSAKTIAALKIHALRIGHQIDPGVPWTLTLDEPPIHLALKAGNFGDEDFFTRAFDALK